MRYLSLLGLLVCFSPTADSGGGRQEIATVVEYLIASQEGPQPQLILPFPPSFTPGVAGTLLPARWDGTARTLTIYLPNSIDAPDYQTLQCQVTYRRGRALTTELVFPPGTSIPFPAPGTDLSTIYDPALRTLTIPLP